MNRRDLLAGSAALGIALCGARAAAAVVTGGELNLGKPVKPPAHGPLNIAFVVGPNTVLIDLAGPWEAFTDAMLPINLYTVAAHRDGVDIGSIKIRPDYVFGEEPRPNVIVVPAQKRLPESVAWIKSSSAQTDITMSVCVGASLVAAAGLFDGLHATTHHSAYDAYSVRYPKVTWVRGPRYVEERDVASAGGETSGIDLALRVVERYFGKNAAATSAETMEHNRNTPRPWA